SRRCSKRRRKKKNRVTKDKQLVIAALIIAIIAPIVRIIAFRRAGESADFQNRLNFSGRG
ncbi:MAG: hypothetical protein KAX27_03740, partial [Candidatus Aminicenantes bacterium]|nr:hypothetical protein [Candidatus Aminicenantes bacterium]